MLHYHDGAVKVLFLGVGIAAWLAFHPNYQTAFDVCWLVSMACVCGLMAQQAAARQSIREALTYNLGFSLYAVACLNALFVALEKPAPFRAQLSGLSQNKMVIEGSP